MDDILSKEYWENRYSTQNHPWDIGYPSPALLGLTREHLSVDFKILIPGAGFGHEVNALLEMGYKDIHVCDWSESSMEVLKEKTSLPSTHIHLQDFFTLEFEFDAILEMTFFCALSRGLRQKYADHCASILGPEGYLLGLWWNSEFDKDGPPFGGSRKEYETLFQSRFEIISMKNSIRSIKPRMGRELEIVMKKRRS